MLYNVRDILGLDYGYSRTRASEQRTLGLESLSVM